MKISEIKNHLSALDQIAFELPDGSLVPSHFHVTEVGQVSKHFIDCGGTVRIEEVANFQLLGWRWINLVFLLKSQKSN
mgnify:CR=1 FL=1